MTVALVTGGSRGIGAGIVKALRANGIKVAVASRTEADCDLWINANLSYEAYRHDLIDRMIVQMGQIDILINNAGSQYECPAIDYEDYQWNYHLELLLTAPFDLSQQAALYMRKHGGGRIINIASVAGITGTRGIIAYSVAKAGLIEMTKCLSNEWLPYGITVNAVAPGFIETKMQTLAGEHKQAMLGRIPAGRFGTVEEVATAVMWLVSEEARYISGICLPVDGGWLAR